MSNSGESFRKFLLLWSGQFVSAIGNGLTSFRLKSLNPEVTYVLQNNP